MSQNDQGAPCCVVFQFFFNTAAHQTRHTRSQLAHKGAKAWRPAAPPQPRTSGRRRPALYAIYISPLASGCCFSTSQTVEERRRKEKMGHGSTPRRKRLWACSRSGEAGSTVIAVCPSTLLIQIQHQPLHVQRRILRFQQVSRNLGRS